MRDRRFPWFLWLGLLALLLAGCATPANEALTAQDLPTLRPTVRFTSTPVPPLPITPAAPAATPTVDSANLTAMPLDGVRVLGYLAYVRPAPEGSGYDDAVQFLPEDVIPPYGVAGATAEIEEQLAQARTAGDADRYLNLYGEFVCGVDDVNGCQLVVGYVRLPMEQTNPEPVVGLAGHIVSLGDGAQYDDKLVLDSPLPIEIGISSAVFGNGYPMLRDTIIAWRDSGQRVTLDGQIISGAPDVNGCQIQVSAICVDGEPVDPLSEWLNYTDDEWGLALRYPPDATARRGEAPFITVAWDDVELVLGCKLPEQKEPIVYGRTESLKAMGYAQFLGGQEPRMGWWVDDRLLGIRYGQATDVRDGGQIRRGNLTCTLSLWQLGDQWFETGNLSPAAQERADIILSTVTLAPTGTPPPGLANPASVFCVEQGGQLELRTDAQGGQYGVCLFADGSECGEWAFYRGECAPAGSAPRAPAGTAPTYSNETLGFALSAPDNWSVQESTEFVVLTRQVGEGLYALFLGVRPEGASEPVFRTGMPAGDFESGGSLTVFNQTIERRLLMLDGKVKVIAYGLARSGGKEFILYLDQVSTAAQPYEDIDISGDVQTEADAIVSSLRLLP